MAAIKIGQAAPSYRLKTLDGQTTALAETWQGRHALLIFLRHLA